MSRDPRLPLRLSDVLPPEQVLPVLSEKVRRSGAKVAQLVTDLAAEAADRQRQQTAGAEREARRARLRDAGVLKPQ